MRHSVDPQTAGGMHPHPLPTSHKLGRAFALAIRWARTGAARLSGRSNNCANCAYWMSVDRRHGRCDRLHQLADPATMAFPGPPGIRVTTRLKDKAREPAPGSPGSPVTAATADQSCQHFDAPALANARRVEPAPELTPELTPEPVL